MKKFLFVVLLLSSSNIVMYYFAYEKGYEEGSSISGIFDSSKKAISSFGVNPCEESTSELCVSIKSSIDRLKELVEEK